MYRRYFKRPLDLVVSIPLFAALLPFLIVIGFVLWIRNGQVIFTQERVGRGGRRFRIIKFCTMTNDRDARGELLPDEQRVTRFGDFLRKFSLDELPQLVNIIKGDMSLVGPRPFIESQEEDCTAHQLRRHEVRPGVTGLAQVCGRNAVSFKNRFRYDVWYVDNCSFSVDMRILYLTVRMVILRMDKEKNVIYDPTIAENFLLKK